MLTIGSGALLYSVFDLKSTSHYATGNQAFFSAESGLAAALNAMNSAGVVDFNTDVVQRWSTLFTPNPQSIPGYANYQYSVSVAADATDPTNRGTITATGTAPDNARRVVRVAVMRNGVGKGSGAIYLAADAVSTTFTGNAFDINGNDHDQFDAPVAGGNVEPGIATRNDTVTSGVVSSLNNQQKDNVKGAGFSSNPLTPSVLTTGGPSVSDLDRTIAQILSRNNNVVTDSSSSISGSVTFGTLASPQITHLTADSVTIKANGNASGAGILIVDNSITINGNLDFTGWIIVRGNTIISDSTTTDSTTVLGNATILGSLWTGDLVVRVGGSAIVDYCSYCMTMADGSGSAGGNIPKAMRVVSWQEAL